MIDPDKELDLHESEWSKDGKKQPILGVNGTFFIFMFVAGLVVLWFMSLMVNLLGWFWGPVVGTATAWLALHFFFDHAYDAVAWIISKIADLFQRQNRQ